LARGCGDGYAAPEVRRSAPIVLVLVMLLPQAAQASAWYQCRSGLGMMSRASCCCPGAHGGEGEQPVQPELRRAACCDLVTSEPRPHSARVESTFTSRTEAPLLVALPAPPAPEVVETSARALPARATAPPPEPIYLRHASLLL
jgi:hypothetical protein